MVCVSTRAVLFKQRPSLSLAAPVPTRSRLQSRRADIKLRAGASDVYVFNLEGVLCEEDGTVYASAQQLQSFEAPFYITSKLESAQISKLLQGAGISIPSDSPQLFTGLDPQQTVGVLTQISGRPVVKENGARLNFLSASSEALTAASKLDNIRLYLAGWSQEGERSKGGVGPDVQLLEEKQLEELLKWGLIMGVDDGCGDDN